MESQTVQRRSSRSNIRVGNKRKLSTLDDFDNIEQDDDIFFSLIACVCLDWGSLYIVLRYFNHLTGSQKVMELEDIASTSNNYPFYPKNVVVCDKCQPDEWRNEKQFYIIVCKYRFNEIDTL